MSSIIKGITDEQSVTKTQPEVQVPGYGTMPLDMLKRHVQSLSKDFNDSIQKGEFLKAAYRTEQFYNALMALAKAMKQQNKVDETHSTGTTVGSAGIGGGVGLGIDKSPIEKVIEKPLGEGELPPKAGFNKKPHKVGPGTSKDDYEYKSYIPRDRKEKGEEWAIARDVRNVNSKLGKKKPKELDTGFYKSYLSNRPIREEEIEEDTAYAGGMGQGGNAGQSYRKYTAKPAGLDEAYRSMFYTMPPSLKDRKKLRAQGARVPLRTYSELAQMLGISFDQLNGLRQKFPDFPKPVAGVAGARHGAIRYFRPDEFQVWLDKHNIKELLGLKKEVGEEQAPMFTPEEKMVNANDPMSDGWRFYNTKESAIMKGLQTEAGSGVTRWSKDNPPPPELLLNTLIQILMNPNNNKSPQDLISLWNEKYGLKHTLSGLRQYAQNDYKKAELSKALQKAVLAYESSKGK